MLVDFAITQDGDLLFHKQDKTNTRFKLSFTVSKAKALKLCMDFNSYEEAKYSSNALKLSFNIDRKIHDKAVIILKDEEALIQLLNIKLKTVLGELPNRPDFGSRLISVKHERINKANLTKVRSYILEAIERIVDEPEVEVSVIKSDLNGYNETISVDIYSKNNKLINYILE